MSIPSSCPIERAKSRATKQVGCPARHAGLQFISPGPRFGGKIRGEGFCCRLGWGLRDGQVAERENKKREKRKRKKEWKEEKRKNKKKRRVGFTICSFVLHVLLLLLSFIVFAFILFSCFFFISSRAGWSIQAIDPGVCSWPRLRFV